MAHHLLKLELSTAARAAGAHVELEVRGPEGAWRADVMASDPGGAWRIALEAQLSPITTDDIGGRTERMLADGVRSVWFSDRPRPPWLGAVPSVRLEAADDGGLVVAEGLAKFSAGWWEAGPRVPVTEFLRWVFTGRVVPHLRQRPGAYPLEVLRTVWTARQYAREERVHVAELERQEREWRQHEAAITALLERQKALTKPSVEFVYQEAGVQPHVAETGVPEFAMGVPVYVRGEPYAVICPVASRVPPLRRSLSSLVLLVASERERQRIAGQAGPEQRIVVLEAAQAPAPFVPQQPGTITIRQAVTRMFGLDRM